jgi:Glycosyl transferase family 2/Methyltransferase domain
MIITAPNETPTRQSWGPRALDEVREARRASQDATAPRRDNWIRSNKYFYDGLKRLLCFVVEPQSRVLAVRCQTGHLLASVKPSYGVGVEIGDVMVGLARELHPELHFVRYEPEKLSLGEKFDYVLFDYVFDTVDILRALEAIREHCTPDTRLIILNYNQLWEPVLELASKIGLRSKLVEPNWVSENDIRVFLKLAGFRPVRVHRRFLFPKWIPLISWMLNNLLARLPGLRRLCLMQITVARPLTAPVREEDVTVSVIVPCRNERGNIQSAVQRIPDMGKGTEILFCDDKSTDGTGEEVTYIQRQYPTKNIRLIEGPGICKAENVWTGFRAARGDVLMILDADLTVMPEELPMFLRALASRQGEFVNGSRLIYPMQQKAMKFTNMVGNKVFGLLFSFLLDQRIKDTLCGTKVLWRKDWLRLEKNLGSWGIKDLWGDYELLFGASKLHLEVVEVPVHYQERIHGVTKMTRVFFNGLRMLRICWYAWRKLDG